MRAIVLAVLIAAAGAAQAQDMEAIQRSQELEMQLSMARQREVALQNQLMALEARLQADRAIQALETQRDAPWHRAPRDPNAPAPAPRLSTPGYVAIPDDRLAASNARVRAAARNTR